MNLMVAWFHGKNILKLLGMKEFQKVLEASTGGRVPKPDRVGVKGRLLKDALSAASDLLLGFIKPKVWREKKAKGDCRDRKRVEQKGYLSSVEDKDDFENETGAGKTKFNKWMNKAGLVFDKYENRWYLGD